MFANSNFGLNSLIECSVTCTLHQASSGSFGSFVSFDFLFFFAVYKQQTSPQLHCWVKRATTKAHWRPPKITPSSFLISIHSRTSGLVHAPISCVVAPERHIKFCFCFSILCFSKRRVAWRPSFSKAGNQCYHGLWARKRIFCGW